MGNQGYSNEGTRQCAEMIWNGEIGNVTEVHAWTNRPAWPQGITEKPTPAEVPSWLDWDLWLGVAADRPYSEDYLPFSWRGFFDFGLGALGDMACHFLGAPNMALRLGAPTSVECVSHGGQQRFVLSGEIVVRFDFPAREGMRAGEDFLVRRDARRAARPFRMRRRVRFWAICPEPGGQCCIDSEAARAADSRRCVYG